jgi:hypothetical protein
MWVPLLLSVLVLAPASAWAQKVDCATHIAAYRLPECEPYFRARRAASGQAQQNSAKLHWISGVHTDPIRDVKTVVVEQQRRNGRIAPHRRQPEIGQQAVLAFFCRGGKDFYVNVIFPDKLVAGYRQSVLYRVDDRSPVNSRGWRSSTDNTTVGQWETPGATAFLARLLDGNVLAFRIESESFGTAEAEFVVEDVWNAIEPVRSACKLQRPRAVR